MLYIRARTLSSAKLPMLKFERVLLIFNPLFFLQMILLRDFQSCGARPLQPSVPMLPANGKYDAPPDARRTVVIEAGHVLRAIQVEAICTAEPPFCNAPDETRIGLLRAPQLLHSAFHHAAHQSGWP
jgi:hypothetical protein